MQRHEIIIIGGGPAGSSCAHQLKRAGRDVLVLDKAEFPRLKLCAGWVTEQVLKDLAFEPKDYPHAFMPMKIRFHVLGLPLIPLSFWGHGKHYSIRRIQFDDWLLKRSGAAVKTHTVKNIEKHSEEYILDDEFSCHYLVGAGGTQCPVRKTFFPELRDKSLQVVTMEKEFMYPARSEICHLFFYYRGLQGYGWYLPKADGAVNIGLGAFSEPLKKMPGNIHTYFEQFVQLLVKRQLLDNATAANLIKEATGHPYFLSAAPSMPVQTDKYYLIGDAAGLASLDLGEGIGPAIQSGVHAAEAILGQGEYTRSGIGRYSIPQPWVRWLMEKMTARS